jgi:hypothetical protein
MRIDLPFVQMIDDLCRRQAFHHQQDSLAWLRAFSSTLLINETALQIQAGGATTLAKGFV